MTERKSHGYQERERDRDRDRDRDHHAKPSKADIAKQFDLPERQSKITSLLSQAGQAYCVCRSSDSSRFMIGCDACEEWYHGDCINISEKEARYIKQYYCDRCRREDPTLTTVFKLQKREHEDGDEAAEERKKKRKEHNKKHSSSRGGCGRCGGCTLVYDCGRCEVCLNAHKYGTAPCRRRACTGISNSSRKSKNVKSSSSGSGARRHRSSSEGQDSFAAIPSHLQTAEPRHCYGPACTRQALYGSKYCSHACGLRLATARIYRVLPQRIQEWSLQPCAAEAADRRALARVREKILEVKAALQKLEQRKLALDDLCTYVKSLTIEETDEEPDEETEMSMYCITCGHEIHSKTAMKHMEKCFNKYEAQASFGSVFKTRIEGSSMFCDFYNPANQTYCKRLKVLCPEHCKEPKINDTDVCGCPLVRDLFKPTGEFCRAPRKSCLKHHGWEKIRRAEVDMERVRQWLKIDELMEQERNIRYAMASRAGVLGLMLHSTYNHELIEKITSQMQQQQMQQQQQTVKQP